MNPNKASYNDHELIKFWPKMKPEINVTLSDYQSKFKRSRKLFYQTDITYNYDSKIWSWNSTKTPVQGSAGMIAAFSISGRLSELYKRVSHELKMRRTILRLKSGITWTNSIHTYLICKMQ